MDRNPPTDPSVEGGMNKIYIDGKEHELEPRTRTRAELAEANIAACRKALEGFWPYASTQLMEDLTKCVDNYESRVRKRLEL